MQPLLTTCEVAVLLGVSSRTVRLWAESLQIPAVKMGKQWRFRPAEIELLLGQGTAARLIEPYSSSTSRSISKSFHREISDI